MICSNKIFKGVAYGIAILTILIGVYTVGVVSGTRFTANTLYKKCIDKTSFHIVDKEGTFICAEIPLESKKSNSNKGVIKHDYI